MPNNELAHNYTFTHLVDDDTIYEKSLDHWPLSDELPLFIQEEYWLIFFFYSLHLVLHISSTLIGYGKYNTFYVRCP